MRYLVTIIWGVVLGEVIGFLVSSLSGTPFNPADSLMASLICVVVLLFLPPIMTHFDTTPNKKA